VILDNAVMRKIRLGSRRERPVTRTIGRDHQSDRPEHYV
jgi:hypothetical protein